MRISMVSIWRAAGWRAAGWRAAGWRAAGARAATFAAVAMLGLVLAAGCGREQAAPNLCDDAALQKLDPKPTDAELALRRAACPAPLPPPPPGGEPLAQCSEGSTILRCPAGAHCNDGKCEVACFAGGEDRCGSGTCTAEGRCVERGWVAEIIDFPATKWVVLILLLVMPLASILTWMERRQSAMMQDRLGPNRANIGPIKLKGILHFVADAVKMIFKEDFIPGNVHRGLFALAPILAIAPVFIAFAIIPFGPTIYPHLLTDTFDPSMLPAGSDALRDSIRLQIWQADFGLIFYFAVLTLANYGGTIAGWASYNKWALLGGLRSSSQMMSYEVSMGLSLMGVFLVVGSLEPGFIVDHGTSSKLLPDNPLNWLWLSQPVGLVLFFTAAIAETKRAPFDIPEGEPEIIGYFVEYSGLRWGLFFLAEFVEIVFISAVITTVFFATRCRSSMRTASYCSGGRGRCRTSSWRCSRSGRSARRCSSCAGSSS
jgi:NADH-quinone oxidoreductase subunit H